MGEYRMPLTPRAGLGFGRQVAPFHVWLQRCDGLYRYYMGVSLPLFAYNWRKAHQSRMTVPEAVHDAIGDRREYETHEVAV